jgi:putative ABC transport system permease protein
MVLLIILGSVALLLASLGIYGVLSYSIIQRTHEIGIRMALGAAKADVFKLILGQSLKLIVIGIGIGLILGLLMIRVFSSLLFGIRPIDPLTFAFVTVVLVLTALVASYIPARHAMKVDPMIALRSE